MMHPSFLLAAAVLLAGWIPLAVVAVRSEPIHGLPAVQIAGTSTTLVLACLAVGTGRSAFGTVALACAAATIVGGVIFARFLDRNP